VPNLEDHNNLKYRAELAEEFLRRFQSNPEEKREVTFRLRSVTEYTLEAVVNEFHPKMRITS
jgi:hypothetical protein